MTERPGTRRRTALAEFLKARRARIDPTDVGLEPGGRRRTAGLRREEVALLAGVGLTWYTWLEQGRPINASYQVLDAIARTLLLDAPARLHLYDLAESTPVRFAAPIAEVPESVLIVLRTLDPVPAVLLNSRFDVIEANDAHNELFNGWHSLPCVHKNLLWCCVTEPLARERITNYDEVVPHLIGRLRAEYARHVDDPEWDEDIRRLSELSEEFRELWARHDVMAPSPSNLRFSHGRAGELTFVNQELVAEGAGDLRIRVYTPADPITWTRLPLTRT
ncbi:helix-turn-helix transcriptional regulator [Allokutzneria sp. NRRL B-24872]|uniref:helix-turn-helix transcriptional regulator n=1 Tax=Allokutzneria sp. NRRL B-24872 TaxID=1137961 RepID=UPI000A37998A|nr:helix-turn-helix transcriptional regulator [Allokutzneria sp. NRRL B-24872]